MRKMQNPATAWLIGIMAVLFLTALTLFLVLYFRLPLSERRPLETEVAKSLLQIMTVAVIGNVALLVVRQYEDQRKAWIARRDLLRTDLSEGLSKLYGRTKQIRRMLRASTVKSTGGLATRRYAELNEELSEIQIALERYAGSAESAAKVAVLPLSVAHGLKSMQRYLGSLLSEFEAVFHEGEDQVTIEKLPVLSEFIGRPAGPSFKSEFVNSYHEVARTIDANISIDLGASSGG